MKKSLLYLAFLLLLSAELAAQDNAYGVLGGLTVGTQRWTGFQRDPLLTWNGRAFYESILNEKLTVVGELGYHNRGSAMRVQAIIPGTGNLVTERYNMRFKNLSFLGAAKQIYHLEENLETYVKLGVRLEYTFGDTLDIFEEYAEAIQPFNYGVTLGGGFHFGPNDGPVQFVLDFQVSPDFSQQIYSPPGQIYNRFTQQYMTVQEQKVVNLSFEVSLGIRFVNKYYQE